MGRIGTTLVKRTGKKLIQKYPDKFTTEFGQNKLAVTSMADCHTTKLRNLVAGYITRLKRISKKV
ncbi:30S ribosomal protein S17e [Candidatus Woesearchaeota archaeon]|nr:30S ribosomal protein S17e [Candidatus Woesearchaeota archaeon]